MRRAVEGEVDAAGGCDVDADDDDAAAAVLSDEELLLRCLSQKAKAGFFLAT